MRITQYISNTTHHSIRHTVSCPSAAQSVVHLLRCRSYHPQHCQSVIPSAAPSDEYS